MNIRSIKNGCVIILIFCDKYNHAKAEQKSLAHFIRKLREKSQSVQQQDQASQAVHVYYQILAENNPRIKKTDPRTETVLEIKKGYKNTKADWRPVYASLSAEINLRHYSPKTLRAYSGWVRQLQAYTKSKDPRLLTSAEVKNFLSFLAEKKKVSASSQNQAFNALLFFYKHILKNDLGELSGIVRAKRKPYIPVVLSREEIDAVVSSLNYPYDLVVKLFMDADSESSRVLSCGCRT